jgi:hypothetical protein
MAGDIPMHATSTALPAGLPPLTIGSVARLLAAGAAGLILWEAFARLVAPLWLGHALDPLGQAMHLLTGLVLFPLGYVLVVRPLAARLAPGLGWPVLGLGYGVALWVFAMYGMASLLGGMPAFLGFGQVAWASLAGHIGLGLGIAATTTLIPGRAR